jgi:glycosyltransferase involved in cell wall biosynthesis
VISICLPTLNAIRFLKERMDSIFSQTHTDWELIVCDSYSDDGTWEYLQTFAGDPRVLLFQVPKEGLYAGWNECLRRVQGEFIYIATADDTMESICLERLLAPFQTCTGASLVIGRVQEIDATSQPIQSQPKSIHAYLASYYESGPFTLASETLFLLLAAFGWGLGSVTGFMFKRSALDRTGLFPTDLGFLGDAEWTLRLSLTGRSVWLPDTVATWRVHGGQASERKRRLLEAKWFHDALARVLDDLDAGIPSAWQGDPNFRSTLLSARQLELHLATQLHRSNFIAHHKSWPRLTLETLKVAPSLLWQRIACGFGSPSGSKFKEDRQFFESWLQLFEAEWPPTRLSMASNRQ